MGKPANTEWNTFTKDGINYNLVVAFYNQDPGMIVRNYEEPWKWMEVLEVREMAYCDLGRGVKKAFPNAIIAQGMETGIALGIPESISLSELSDAVGKEYDCIFMLYSEALDTRNQDTYAVQLAGFPR